MTETTSHNEHDDPTSVDDADRLMTRIIDGEVSSPERRQFERLAADDPGLWRKLAERQQDMLELSQEVDSELSDAFRVTIDRAQQRRATLAADASAARWNRPLWWLGWAAALGLAAAWLIVASIAPPTEQADPAQPAQSVPALRAGETLPPEDALGRYLESPFVVGELDPIMLQHEARDDGSIELRILRRIEERYLLDPDESLPLDPDGRLLRDPGELRRRSIETN